MWYEFNADNKTVIIKHPRTIGYRWIRTEEVPTMLRYPDTNPNLELTKIDKNGTKYYKTNICPVCNGNKVVRLGSDDYDCNKCSGNGFLEKAKIYKIHSHEYGLILEQEYITKQNIKFFDKYGINDDGTTYVYLGNTYFFKDLLKSKGAKYDDTFKWHSKTLIDGYDYIKISVPLKYYSNGSIGYDYGRDEKDYNKRINSLLDDVLMKIKVANKSIKDNH